MDKGKTTRIISGGGYCDKNGKRHQWSKLHVPQPEITDDNWMEYGMPDDEEDKVSNESRNMKRTVRLTESELRRMISETVRRALNEVSGWSLEKDDVTWVNDAESGGSDKAWMVRLWTGSGYYLPAFGAYASSEEDALEKVIAYLDKEGAQAMVITYSYPAFLNNDLWVRSCITESFSISVSTTMSGSAQSSPSPPQEMISRAMLFTFFQ